MRLLTIYKELISNNNVGQFESNLEQDLDLPPNTKMALVNANLKFNTNFIEITTLNNVFKFYTTKTNFDNDEPYLVTMEVGKFNSITLLDNIQSALNASLPYLGQLKITAGLSTNCILGTDNKFNIQLANATSEKFDPVLNPNNLMDIAGTTSNPLLTRTSVPASNNWNAFSLLDKVPINKGPALANFSTTVNISTTQFFAIGLLNEIVDYSGVSALPPTSYAVSLSNNPNGKYVINGVESDLDVETDDAIFMSISEGAVEFYKDNTLIGLPIPYKKNLGKADNYVYMSLFGSGASMGYGSYHFDPFFTPPADEGKVGANPNSIFTIDFADPLPGSDLADLLGFSDSFLQLQGNQSVFNASFPLNFEVAEDAGLNILIENLPLKSFNFTDGINKSQPILHTIPAGVRDTLGITSYIPPYRVEVDLNNAFPLNLRNLRFAVRNVKDNSIVDLDEICLSIAVL